MAVESEKIDIEVGESIPPQQDGDQDKIPEIIGTNGINKEQVNLDVSGDTSGSEDSGVSSLGVPGVPWPPQNKKSKRYRSILSLQSIGASLKSTASSLKSNTSEFFRIHLANPILFFRNPIFMAFLSMGLTLCYNKLFTDIEDKIESATVLFARGVIQIIFMGTWVAGSSCASCSCGNCKPRGEESNTNVENRQHGRCYPRRCTSLFLSKTSRQARAILLLSVSSTVAGVRLAILLAALKSSTMGTTNAIMNASPLIVMLISHFFLDDRFTKLRFLAAGFLALGIVFSAIPSDDDGQEGLNEEELTQLEGAGLALITMTLSAIGTCLFKPLTKSFEKTVISFWYGVGVAIAGGFQLYFMDDNQNDKDGDLPKFPSDPEIWRYVIAIGIFGALQQFCLIAAVSTGSPVTTSMIRASGIAGSFFLQYIGSEPNPANFAIVGAVVISVAAIASAIENTKFGKEMNEKLDSWFKCSRRQQSEEQIEADQSANV